MSGEANAVGLLQMRERVCELVLRIGWLGRQEYERQLRHVEREGPVGDTDLPVPTAAELAEIDTLLSEIEGLHSALVATRGALEQAPLRRRGRLPIEEYVVVETVE